MKKLIIGIFILLIIICYIPNRKTSNSFVFLGKKFCKPGFTDKDCNTQIIPKPLCSTTSDRCFFTEETGVCSISYERWQQAQLCEQNVWKNNKNYDDRKDDHISGFNQYNDVPNDMGNVLEIGPGPWTQLGFLLDLKPMAKVKTITLWEPSLFNYIKSTPTCAYKDGKLRGRTVTLNASGAEKMTLVNAFDVIIMINVIEHVQDAYAIMTNIFNGLRDGGIIIFNDRWNDKHNFDQDINVDVCHPIQCKRAVFEQFMSVFDTVFKKIDPPEVTKYRDVSGNQQSGVYFIGRKNHRHFA